MQLTEALDIVGKRGMETDEVGRACAAMLKFFTSELQIMHHRKTKCEAFERGFVGSKDKAARESLISFANAMEAKLVKNDHKTEWSKLPVDAFIRRLKNEIAELDMAIDYETPDKAMGEAVDVANFGLIIWDVIRNGGLNDRQAPRVNTTSTERETPLR